MTFDQHSRVSTHVHASHSSKFPLILGGIVISLLLIQVVVSNSLTNYGSIVVQTESEISRVGEENRMLSEKIASASALLTLQQKAAQLGFIKSTSPVYMTELPMALGGQFQ